METEVYNLIFNLVCSMQWNILYCIEYYDILTIIYSYGLIFIDK